MIREAETALAASWLDNLQSQGSRVASVLTAAEREQITKRVLRELALALESESESEDVENSDAFKALRGILSDLSANFAERGLTPSETATFVFSLKEVIFNLYSDKLQGNELVKQTWKIGQLIDRLGLYTFEAFSSARERLVKSQAQAIAELATPVIKVWDGIIALPLVGAVDSARAKDIMESLLSAVVRFEADIAIIDITGVPVVDTQVANRLMRTVEAVRLLGTRSIITGINPVIAQTLVQLGVDLSQLSTKASLESGLKQAFRDLKLRVVSAAEARG